MPFIPNQNCAENLYHVKNSLQQQILRTMANDPDYDLWNVRLVLIIVKQCLNV